MDRDEAVDEAGRVWRTRVAPINDLKKRIRAEAEAQIEREITIRRADAARAIHEALSAGASKAKVRTVTTKDFHDFERYVDLGKSLSTG